VNILNQATQDSICIQINPWEFREALNACYAVLQHDPKNIYNSILFMTRGEWICLIASNGKTNMISVAVKGSNLSKLPGDIVLNVIPQETWEIVENDEPVYIQFKDNTIQFSQYRWNYGYVSKLSITDYPIRPEHFHQPVSHLFEVDKSSFYNAQKDMYLESDPMQKRLIEIGATRPIPVIEYHGAPTPIKFGLSARDLLNLDKIPTEKLHIGIAGSRILITNEDKTYKYLVKGLI